MTMIYIKMAKNHQFRLLSCYKWCIHWLCLSIISFFLCRAGIFQIFAWLNMCVYIFPCPDRFFSLTESEKTNGERGRKWRRECVQHISLDVGFHPSRSCDRGNVWEHFGRNELWPSVNNGPSPVRRAKLSWTKACPQPPSHVQIPFMWIFIME